MCKIPLSAAEIHHFPAASGVFMSEEEIALEQRLYLQGRLKQHGDENKHILIDLEQERKREREGRNQPVSMVLSFVFPKWWL